MNVVAIAIAENNETLTHGWTTLVLWPYVRVKCGFSSSSFVHVK